MNTIHLHGALAKEFGGPFRLDVKTPAEAIIALGRLRPGFEERIREGAWRVVRGPRRGGRALTENELGINLPGEMHLLAAPKGRKNGGTGKVILGAVLIAFAVIAAIPTAGASLGFVVAGEAAAAGFSFGATASLGLGISVTAGQIAMLGAGMMLAGISQMLAPSPKAAATTSSAPQDTRASYLFSGQINSAEQGVAVPLALGEGIVGGVIISLNVETADA